MLRNRTQWDERGRSICFSRLGPLNARMEPSDGSPLFHANFWSEPSDFYPNLGLKTSQNPLEPSDFHPDFDLGHHEHCLNLAILTPIGLALSEVFRSDVYIEYSLNNSNYKTDADEGIVMMSLTVI